MNYKAAVCISAVLLLLNCETAKTRSTTISANNKFNATIGSLKKEFNYLNIHDETGVDTTWIKFPKGFEFLWEKVKQEEKAKNAFTTEKEAHISTEEEPTVQDEKIEKNAEASHGDIYMNIPQWGKKFNKFGQKKRLCRMLAEKKTDGSKLDLAGKPGAVPGLLRPPVRAGLGGFLKPGMPWRPGTLGGKSWPKGKGGSHLPWAPLPKSKASDSKTGNSSDKSDDEEEDEEEEEEEEGNGNGLFGEYDQLLSGMGGGNPLLQSFLAAANGTGGMAGMAGLAGAALGGNKGDPRAGLPYGGRPGFFKGRLQYSSKGVKRTGWGKFCYFLKNLLCCLFIFATNTPYLSGSLGGVLQNPMVGSVMDLVEAGSMMMH